MNSVMFSIASFSVTWYSFFILIGIALAGLIIEKEAKKYNIPNYFITNLIFWCVIFGIVGARIYYVLFNLDYYSLYPIEIIKVWNGGLAIHGGIIGGIIVIVLYCRKYGVNPIRMMDIAVPGVILAQAIGRWGNFFNSEAHGGIVSRNFLEGLHLPEFIIEGMHIAGKYYHPTFLYESILCVLGFLVLLSVRHFKKLKLGQITSLYLIWYGIIRFFIESLRTDSLMLGSFKMAQIISIIMVITGIIMFVISSFKNVSYFDKKGGIKNAK